MIYLKGRAQIIHQEENDLDIIQDADLDFEDEDLKFEHVDKFWTLYFNWKMKKDPWLELSLIPEVEIPFHKELTIPIFNEIKRIIEEGGKTLNESNDYFKKINPNIFKLLGYMNN